MQSTSAAADINEIIGLLREAYPSVDLSNRDDPTEELVLILLSAKTEEYNYLRTFASFRRAFRSWDDAAAATEADILDAIRSGGLATKKARQLHRIFQVLTSRYGTPTLPSFAGESDSTIEEALTSLPGVGLKTARCTMLFAYGRQVFPVDTHVWRVMGRLGLAAQTTASPSDQQQRALEADVPKPNRRALHERLVYLGRRTCVAFEPRCPQCPLMSICPTSRASQRPGNGNSGRGT